MDDLRDKGRSWAEMNHWADRLAKLGARVDDWGKEWGVEGKEPVG